MAWIGDYEIRMHAAVATSGDQQILFILDIFDHDTQRFIDSRGCRTLAEGAVAFEEFLFLTEPVAGRPN